MDDAELTELLRDAAEFGECGECVYVQAGYPLLCSRCAARTLEPLLPIDQRCRTCDHPLREDGACGNGPCYMGPANRGFEWNWSIAMRTGVLLERINDYKFRDRSGWGLIFGRILVGFLERNAQTFRQADLIIPSPTYIGKDAERAWDHTARIVEAAAQEQGEPPWPFVIDPPVIIKTAETPSMSGITRYQDRKANAETNVRPALLVPDPDRVKGKAIVVIDDVFTDGLTLREVARALRSARARVIYGVALARQTYRGS